MSALPPTGLPLTYQGPCNQHNAAPLGRLTARVWITQVQGPGSLVKARPGRPAHGMPGNPSAILDGPTPEDAGRWCRACGACIVCGPASNKRIYAQAYEEGIQAFFSFYSKVFLFFFVGLPSCTYTQGTSIDHFSFLRVGRATRGVVGGLLYIA